MDWFRFPTTRWFLKGSNHSLFVDLLIRLVSTLHLVSVYVVLNEFPGAQQISPANLTRLKALLYGASKGHYDQDMAVVIRDAARNSIGSRTPAKSMQLRHTIKLIQELDAEIDEIETEIGGYGRNIFAHPHDSRH